MSVDKQNDRVHMSVCVRWIIKSLKNECTKTFSFTRSLPNGPAHRNRYSVPLPPRGGLPIIVQDKLSKP